MKISNTVEEVRKQVKEWKQQGLTVGLVPTMGALHEGHASLVETSVKCCDRTVASVFVNPTQFGKNEDLDSYPRDFEKDCELLLKKGCDMVFHPSVDEMYPAGFGTYTNIETDITTQLCGKSRPGHFRGVCTVVSKLFNIVDPDAAFFGEKDAQQLAVIKQMVRDMNFDIKIVGCPIVREADGLAKSSRNSYLDAEERKAAVVLYQAIDAAKRLLLSEGVFSGEEECSCSKGEKTHEDKKDHVVSISTDKLVRKMTDIISAEPLAKIDYIEAVDGMTLLPKDEVGTGDLVALAVYIGKIRLIDNFTI